MGTREPMTIFWEGEDSPHQNPSDFYLGSEVNRKRRIKMGKAGKIVLKFE